MPNDADQDLLRRRLLRRGVAADEIEPGVDLGRDVRLVAGPGGKDLATVAGMENLTQALAIALTTPLGGDALDVGFGYDGLRALVEETDPFLQRERIRVSVVRVLQRDPRVRRVVDVTLAPEEPRAARHLRVEVEFETVAGDRARAVIGEV